ncbi:MAG: hypothetical protein WCO44_06230 [Bacteroidota bacterium]
MNANLSIWYKKQFKNRKLIDAKEGAISILQVLGFTLIISGIVYLFAMLFSGGTAETTALSGGKIAIAFFIVMTGVAFAFPSLLQDQTEGLSTMRIVVFMVVNVICILLLKIGWGQKNLGDVGLDQYWVGVIAFVFGAKATQSFFESKMAVPKEVAVKTGMAAITFSPGEVARLAIQQNQQFLRVKFPNILSLSDAVHDLSLEDSHVVAIYLRDNNTAGIPDKLEVRMPDGVSRTIGTEIIRNTGSGKVHVNQYDAINTMYNTDSGEGSICCLVDTNKGFKAAVTAGHVFTRGASVNYHGELDDSQQTAAWISNKNRGQWFFQLINYSNDLALATLDNYTDDPQCIHFKEHYEVTDKDVCTTQVTLISKESGRRTGYILDYNTEWDVDYRDGPVSKGNIILTGSTKIRDNSSTLSTGGDSGGCVYTADGKLVGLILGGNDKFTWVLPIKETLDNFNYTLI